jgi:hypothetical protein
MIVILLEGVLFVAAIAMLAALLFSLILKFTPVGVWVRQNQNRKKLERAAELTCPIHGLRSETDLIRLTNGERVCPDCYKESIDGNVT